MNSYTYKNKANGEVVVIQASDILEADKVFKSSKGVDPVKAFNIGCSISFNIEEQA